MAGPEPFNILQDKVWNLSDCTEPLGVQMGQMRAFWWKLRLHISCPNSAKDCPHLGVSENVVYPAILIESDHQTLNSGFHHLPVQHCHHCLQFLWCLIGHVMSQLITPFRCDEEHHVVHGNALNLPRNRGAEENLPQWTSMYCCILILFGIVCHSSISFSHFQSLEIKNDSVFKYLKPVFAPPDEHVGIG